MPDPIGPSSTTGATGSTVDQGANDRGSLDQATIDHMKMQLAILKASGSSAPPQLVAKLKELLAAAEGGSMTPEAAGAAYEKAKAEATDASINQMTDTMIPIVANAAVNATHDPFLDEIKKEMEDDQ